MQWSKQEIQSILDQYLTIFPEEKEELAPLFSFLESSKWDLYDRKNMDGHIVSSGVIMNREKKQTLLIYHNTFERYQQPGWHVDPGETVLQWTLRECIEETGIQKLDYLPLDVNNTQIPLDIWCHIVRANDKKDEWSHWHFNFIYAFATDEKTPVMDDDGVSDAQWFALDEIGKVLPKIPHKIQFL